MKALRNYYGQGFVTEGNKTLKVKANNGRLPADVVVSSQYRKYKTVDSYDSNLTPSKVNQILDEYGKDGGIEKDKIKEFFESFKDKNYCLLIFLKNPEKIKPFGIDKTGFGMMSAWLIVGSIDRVKV